MYFILSFLTSYLFLTFFFFILLSYLLLSSLDIFFSFLLALFPHIAKEIPVTGKHVSTSEICNVNFLILEKVMFIPLSLYRIKPFCSNFVLFGSCLQPI